MFWAITPEPDAECPFGFGIARSTAAHPVGVTIAGRASGAADEVWVNETTAATFGLQVGSGLRLRTVKAADTADWLAGDGCAPVDGPEIPARVTSIVRSFEDVTDTAEVLLRGRPRVLRPLRRRGRRLCLHGPGPGRSRSGRRGPHGSRGVVRPVRIRVAARRGRRRTGRRDHRAGGRCPAHRRARRVDRRPAGGHPGDRPAGSRDRRRQPLSLGARHDATADRRQEPRWPSCRRSSPAHSSPWPVQPR